MKELNFDNFPTPNGQAENIEEIKGRLSLLAEDISNYAPESEEFSKIKASFIEIQPVVAQKIREYIERERDSDIHFSMDREYVLYFKLINQLNLLDEANKEMAAELFIFSTEIDRVIAEDILKKRKLYKSEEKNIKQDNYLAGYILKKFNFSEEEISDLIQSWLSIEDDDGTDWYIAKNLSNIRSLEDFEKNSSKYLYNTFGIRGFGRYRMHELKKQYEKRDDMGPYGLYCQAVMDWNGSFSQSNQSEELREQIEENSFLIRIIEVKGKIDLAKRLLSLRDKYQQKIKFMYLHAHGNTDVIGLGDREGNDRKFLQEDLKGKGVQRVKELFEDDAELVLSSCLTGVEGGLAEEMSNTYKVKVIASDKPTEGAPSYVEVKKNAAGSNLEFKIIFKTMDLDNEKDSQRKKGTVIYHPKG